MTFLEFDLPDGRKVSLLLECIESIEVDENGSGATDIGTKSGCFFRVGLPYEKVKEQVELARMNLQVQQSIDRALDERIREMMGQSLPDMAARVPSGMLRADGGPGSGKTEVGRQLFARHKQDAINAVCTCTGRQVGGAHNEGCPAPGVEAEFEHNILVVTPEAHKPCDCGGWINDRHRPWCAFLAP